MEPSTPVGAPCGCNGAAQPEGDIYDIARDGSARGGWKKLLNALLFADKPLKRWPRVTRELFSGGTRLPNAIRAIKDRHRPIAPLFERGLGFELMFIESELLIPVLLQLSGEGITALPLHDSVLVAVSQAERAKELMIASFEACTGLVGAIVSIEETAN